MTDQDDHLERLICRKLDGVISESEALELDKLLIRDPRARARLEQSQRIEAQADALIDEICAVRRIPQVDQQQSTRQDRGRLWYVVVPASLAAMLVLSIGWLPELRRQDRAGIQTRSALAGGTGAMPLDTVAPTPAHWADRVPEQYQQFDTRSTYFTVHDPGTGKTYLLEWRQTDSALRPLPADEARTQNNVVLTSGDM